jgi:hypothetical protein
MLNVTFNIIWYRVTVHICGQGDGEAHVVPEVIER